jgi:hypothetical protein
MCDERISYDERVCKCHGFLEQFTGVFSRLKVFLQFSFVRHIEEISCDDLTALACLVYDCYRFSSRLLSFLLSALFVSPPMP